MLHAGNVVRLAPNRYSIIDPQAAKDIYAISSNFTKSAFYDPFGPPLVNRKDVFSTRIDRHHQEDRRKTASMYSLTSLLSYEPYIDSSNAALCEKMQGFAQTNQPFNLMQWSQFYAFDVIGEITFGKAFGMMETGSDVDGILKTIHLTAFIPSYLGLLPELSNLFYRALSFLVKESPLLSLQTFGARALAERKNGRAPSDREDFLAKCQKLNEAGKLDDRLAGQVPTGNVIAGSDTTGITLAAALYHLIRNPDSMRKLQHELDEATHRGELSQAATYAEATKLPYLQAVIKETLRIHPAVGTILPRVVPAGGKQLAGYYFPEGVSIHSHTKSLNHPSSRLTLINFLYSPSSE
jgi:cytochrome P450